MASATRSSLLVSLLLTGVSSLPSSIHYSRDAVPAFSPLGCFTDNEGGVRALSDIQTASDGMTIEQCAAFCSRYNLFGVEYGRECFCGNTKADSSREVDASDCSFPCAGNPDQKCGAGNRLNVYTISAPVAHGPATLEGVTSLGCFVDYTARVFPYEVIGADDMTAAKCAAHCGVRGFEYFGTQWSRECYCGISAPTHAAPASECSMPCAGNPDEVCGAGMRLNAYKFDDHEEDDCEVGGFDYQGCYTDNVPHRVLSAATFFDHGMTPAKCAASCSAAGYSVFGTEYGTECYCGTALSSASTKVDDSECDTPCAGDPTASCGARDRLSVYSAQDTPVEVPAGNLETIGEFRYASCYADNLGSRVLQAVDYRADDMTVEKCAARCANYLYFGLQYGRECYCGNELQGGGSVLPESDCGMVCMGDMTQLCGGPARMNLYTREPAPASSSAQPDEPSSSSVVSSSAAAASSSEAPVVPSSSSSVPASSAAASSSAPVAVPSSSAAPAAPASSASLSAPSSSSSPLIASSIPASSSVLPSSSSSTPTVPTTTAGPVLTTITICPASSTVDNPYGCFASGSHPAYINTLLSTNWNSRGLSSIIIAARRSITTYGNTVNPATSCFPTSVAATPANSAVAQSTAQSVYSCLMENIYCTYASSCTTNTYEATAVPSAAPTPSVGVNLLQNPSFELTDAPAGSNWTFYGPASPNFPQGISTARYHSGSKSYVANYLNINGASTHVQQVVRSVQPGATYSARAFFMHTNQAATGTFTLAAQPGGFTTTMSLGDRAVDTWHEIKLENIVPLTNYLEITVRQNGQVVGFSGTEGGKFTVYVDDVEFSRVN